MKDEKENAKLPFAQWGIGALASASWIGALAILGLQMPERASVSWAALRRNLVNRESTAVEVSR